MSIYMSDCGDFVTVAAPLKLGAAAFATVLRTVRPPLVIVSCSGCDLSDVDLEDAGYSLLAYKSPKQVLDRAARGGRIVVWGDIPAAIVERLGETGCCFVAAYITNERRYRASRADDAAADVRAAIAKNRATYEEFAAATEGNMVGLLLHCGQQ